jgi:hypothetical protein
VAVATLVSTLTLGACTDMYLDRRDTVSFGAGDAVAANQAIQTIDPWPVYSGRTAIAYDGERSAAAAERYRTNKVTPPRGMGTSSVKVEQNAASPGGTPSN